MRKLRLVGNAFQKRFFFELFGSSASVNPQPNFKESRLIPYTQEQIYDVVIDVDKYKEFLPWCIGSQVMKKEGPNKMKAELIVGYKNLKEKYLSNITATRPHIIDIKAADQSVFKYLESKFQFSEGTSSSCKVTFTISYEFNSLLHGMVAKNVFDTMSKDMIKSIVHRCEKIYGLPTTKKQSNKE